MSALLPPVPFLWVCVSVSVKVSESVGRDGFPERDECGQPCPHMVGF
jgi:hypothetical protein